MNAMFLSTPVPPPPNGELPPVGPVTGTLREWLILLGVILVLTVIIAGWIVKTSKRRRRHERHYSYPKSPGPETHHEHRHRRRRRREHRPMNPTLAQTGGLPPIRPEGDIPDSGQPPTP